MRTTLLLFAVVWVLAKPVCGQEAQIVWETRCNSTTCHGGVAGDQAWRTSAHVWASQDPHASAGLVLLSPWSREIVAALLPQPIALNLDEDASIQLLREPLLGVLRERCFSCHVTHTEQTDSPDRMVDAIAVGVACQSCHGPASIWQKTHVQTDWTAPRDGMLDTKNWASRVQMCARCHVGSRSEEGPARDVNHDLIAAGHPALRFEPLAYSSNQPRHWAAPDEDASKLRKFETGRWLALAAAADLAAERASAFLKQTGVAWPELADYDCFACHHDLQTEGHRGASSNGLPSWNPWYVAGTDRRFQRLPELQLTPGQTTPQQQIDLLRRVADGANLRAAQAWDAAAKDVAQEIGELRSMAGDVRDWYQAVAWSRRLEVLLDDCEGQQLLETEQLAQLRQLSNPTQFNSPTDYLLDDFEKQEHVRQLLTLLNGEFAP
jgi:hypothetical protein